MRRVVYLALVAATALLPAAGVRAESDADIAMANQIGQRLRDSGQLRDYKIGVKYLDGVVWLGGSVTSAAQRDAAVRMVRGMPDVLHVESRLEISGKSSSTGSDLIRAFDPVDATPRRAEPAAAARAPSGVLPAVATSFRQRAPQRQNAGGGQRLATSAQNYAAPSRPRTMPRNNMPLPAGRRLANPAIIQTSAEEAGMAYGPPPSGGGGYAGMGMAPAPTAYVPGGSARAVSYDNAQMPGYAWPSYASYPNYAALTYPQQYSPTAWPYIGPFYPYPQVPLAWRKVSLEWDDGWWFLDFSAHNSSH